MVNFPLHQEFELELFHRCATGAIKTYYRMLRAKCRDTLKRLNKLLKENNIDFSMQVDLLDGERISIFDVENQLDSLMKAPCRKPDEDYIEAIYVGLIAIYSIEYYVTQL